MTFERELLDYNLKELETVYTGLSARLGYMDFEDPERMKIVDKRQAILGRMAELRRLQYHSQFVMDQELDDYDY